MKKLIVLIAAILISTASCSADSTKVQTIEEAETLIAAKGLILKDKKQNMDVIVGDRVFKYTIDDIGVSLLQFSSEKAMNAWADMIESSPIGGSKIFRKGQVAIQVWQGPDDVRQKILSALGSE